MYTHHLLNILISIGSTLVAAAPQTPYGAPSGSLIQRDEKSYIQDACTGMPDKEGYQYRVGITWMQNGAIGGDGNPSIESSGGLLTYDADCNLQDEIGWNGGGGYPNEWMKFKPDDPEVKVKFKMANAALQGGHTRLVVPKDLMFKKDNGEDVIWGQKVDCQKEWNTVNFGAVRYYRMCHFYAGRGYFEDQFS